MGNKKMQAMRGAIVISWLLLAATTFAADQDGFTEPYRKIDVAAAEMGVVGHLYVREGDHVSKGQVLATLDNDVLTVTRDIAETTAKAQGKIDSAVAEVELHKTRLNSLTALAKEDHATHEEVDRARTELAVAEATLLVAREQRHLDEMDCKKIAAMIERRTMRSPIDGVVVKVYRDECEAVSPSSAAVVNVVQLHPLRASFMLPTEAVAKLAIGQSVAVEFPDTGKSTQGTIEFLSPVTDADSGTVRVKLVIDNSKGDFRSGVRCVLPSVKSTKPDKAAVTLNATRRSREP